MSVYSHDNPNKALKMLSPIVGEYDIMKADPTNRYIYVGPFKNDYQRNKFKKNFVSKISDAGISVDAYRDDTYYHSFRIGFWSFLMWSRLKYDILPEHTGIRLVSRIITIECFNNEGLNKN
jgi:hypothetical protein